MAALVDQARQRKVNIWVEHFVAALFKTPDGSRIAGALVIDQHSGELTLVKARAVVLCSGGGGLMYAVTTNAASNTADGYALALRLGVELVDMEMIQFHPTGMIMPASMRGKLVTEGVRGEGGRLYNRDGERFMERYNPQRLELAGRDEVARAIFSEVQAGRGTAEGGVYLSVAHLAPAIIEERLPTMLAQFLAAGVDIRTQPMQIHPSMHHMMGGVRIDEWGGCNLTGLFAAGEVSGGDHGGNRLGGNALASCQVMGKRAAVSAAKFAAEHPNPVDIDADQVNAELIRLGRYLVADTSTPITPTAALTELQSLMWANVGIKRTAGPLAEALTRLAELKRHFADHVRAAKTELAFNRQWIACLELENMIDTAQTVVYAALLREDSRGAHFRDDFPTPVASWERRNIVIQSHTDPALPDRMRYQIVDQSQL